MPNADPPLRALEAGDAPWALALNARFVALLSPLDGSRFESLRRKAHRAWAVGAPGAEGLAFLLAFDERSDYDGAHFQRFRRTHARFVYVDRIVVAPGARRGGLARRLYEALFAEEAGAARRPICCEVVRVPPNPRSDAFHAALGFTEAGRAEDGGKTVRYLVRDI